MLTSLSSARGIFGGDGLATLGPHELALMEGVDARALEWARGVGAIEIRFPPLVSVSDLETIDYFANFPHLPVLASRLASSTLASGRAAPVDGVLRRDDLVDAGYAFPSAACYGIYFHLRGTDALTPTRITTRARCFRNEDHYEGLRRLWGFEMREIVYLGDADGAAGHVAAFKSLLSRWCDLLALPASWHVAGDPFFNKQGGRALAQKIAPVKEELRYRGELAIASVNVHRNFFGERCRITDGFGDPVHTSCVAFGLERWVQALQDSGRVSVGDPAAPAGEVAL